MAAFSRNTILLVAGASLLLLSFLVIFPAHYDQYIFYVGGEKLVEEGAVPYRDLIDTKPGLIFYIYGFSTWLFGHSLYAARWLDLLFHIATLYYFFTILRREFSRQDIALLSVLIYAAMYVAGGPFATGQSESYALLANLFLLDITLRACRDGTSKRLALSYGALSGVAVIYLFLLKYTLALFLIVPVFIITYKKKTRLQYFVGLLGSLVLGLGAWLMYLALNEAWPNVIENIRWLREYSATNPLGELSTIKEKLFVTFADHITTTFSLSFIVLGAIGSFLVVRKGRQEPLRLIIVQYLLLQFLVGTLTILLERKFLYYQYTRVFWCAAPFIAFGVLAVRDALRQSILSRATYIGVAALAWSSLLFFSPLTEVAGFAIRASSAASLQLTEIREAMVDKPLDKAYRFVARELEPKLAPRDEIFIFGHHSGAYFYLDRTSPTFLLNSGFLTAAWTPEAWKEQMIAELKQAKPKFILIEFNDVVPIINASLEDSWQHFLKWPAFREWVYAHYIEIMPVNRFRIFELRR